MKINISARHRLYYYIIIGSMDVDNNVKHNDIDALIHTTHANWDLNSQSDWRHQPGQETPLIVLCLFALCSAACVRNDTVYILGRYRLEYHSIILQDWDIASVDMRAFVLIKLCMFYPANLRQHRSKCNGEESTIRAYTILTPLECVFVHLNAVCCV